MSQGPESLEGHFSIKDARVRFAMSAPVVTVFANAMIEDALNLMLDNHISGLPVLDSDGLLVGVITEYDVLRFYRESDSNYHPFQPCREFMTTAIVTIHPDATLNEATTGLLQTSVRRLLVVDEDRLEGVISRRDIARFIRDERAAQAQLPWTPAEE
ncbi:MAG: CBS domain-containing protein [Planctomycetes bacterium]|nr:CBS domain-containing protein [Planctomycetota bacterium]